MAPPESEDRHRLLIVYATLPTHQKNSAKEFKMFAYRKKGRATKFILRLFEGEE